ncbi:MAG: polysaccharide biosynthesis protein [Planctomycetes bacterium]|nr:polysaccharide biosynthesis protein [Planctomycetota bacterium]
MTDDTPPSRSRVGQLVINVVANYGYYAVGMVVGVVLTPFLNNRLGREVFGEWFFLIGLTLYFSLADAGFNAATVKYVSEHLARREWAAAGRIMAASLRFFVAIAAAFALLAVGTVLFPRYLVLPALIAGALQFLSAHTGIVVLAIILGNWAVEMAFAPFNAALFGAQRYDLARAVAVLARLAKFAAILVLIGLGHGVIALALVTVGEALLRGLFQWWLVRRKIPELPLGFSGAQPETYRKFFRFSAWIVVSNLAYKLIMLSDIPLVQFTRAGERENVLYNAAMQPILETEQLLWALAQVLVPFAAAGAALADRRLLQETIVRGARFTLLMALPILTYLLLGGRGLYGAWMYHEKEFPLEHVAQAQLLLWILAPAFLLLFLQQPAIAVFVGSGRVRVPALLNLVQGVVKIALSLWLVQYFGLAGIALGTVIPLAVVNGLVFPRFVRRELGVGWGDLCRGALLPAGATALIAGPLAWLWLELTGAAAMDQWRFRYQIPIALGVALLFAATAWFTGLKADDRRWIRARLPFRRRRPGPLSPEPPAK